MARTDIIFTRLDTPPLNDDEFSFQFENWLSVIVDVINEDYTTLENSFVRGTVTLAGGTATVLTDSVNTGDTVFTSIITAVNPGFITVSIVDGVSFTLTSSNGADASTLSYMITKI
ncbi:MAG TPA: hypothetical protein VN763_10655 [Saprospiraceae bacterium]|nr:hypothetical protein [Saprospiraceae bacterium]